MFSVVVPTRGRPALLERALRSVLAQRDAEFEIVVAEDGAGEGAAAAAWLEDGRIAVIETGGAGQVPARNMAVRRATRPWIAFLDDDDWWADAFHLAGLAAALARGVGLAYASGRIVRETEEAEVLEELPLDATCTPASLRRDNTLLVPGIAYRRDLHDRLGPFDESLGIYWDWDWYLRLAAAGVPFAASGGTGVRVSARAGTASAPDNEAVRRAELARLCAKHGLEGVTLKNHETIAREQRGKDGG